MNNVKDQKAQIAQLQRDRIYEMLKELNDDKLINPNESSNTNIIYNDSQNVHSSSIQQSIKDSIYRLMNSYIIDYPLT